MSSSASTASAQGHMSEVDRYFYPIAHYNPMAREAAETEEKGLELASVEDLLPSTYRGPLETSEDGTLRWPGLPNGNKWEDLRVSDALAEEVEDEKYDTAAPSDGPLNWMKTLVLRGVKAPVQHPVALAHGSNLSLDHTHHSLPKADAHTPDGRLRGLGEALGRHSGEAEPTHVTNRAVGHRVRDMPPMSAGFGAGAGVNVRLGSSLLHVVSAQVSATKRYASKGDAKRHKGVPSLKHLPRTPYGAARMEPGTGYAAQAEQAALAGSLVKGTATPAGLIPGLSSMVGLWLPNVASIFMDVGPYVAAEPTLGYASRTTLEQLGGSGTRVSVGFDLDRREVPFGKDTTWRAGVGGYVDGGLAEYGARGAKLFRDYHGGHAKRGEPGKRETVVLDKVDRFNRLARVFDVKVRRQVIEGDQLSLNFAIDLETPAARQRFARFMGGSRGVMDLAAFDETPALLRSKVAERTTSRTVNHVLGVSGLGHGSEWGRLKETRAGSKSDGSKLQEVHHARHHHRRSPTRSVRSMTVGRVRTQKQGAQAGTTAIGFGWTFSSRSNDARDLAGVLAMARAIEGDRHDTAYHDAVLSGLEQRLGQAKGEVQQADFSLHMNVAAVRVLLSHLDGGPKEQALWRRCAAAYADHHALVEPPSWPGSGAPKKPRRRLARAFELLRRAAEETEPEKGAKHLCEAFDLLRRHLELAAPILALATGGARGSCQFKVEAA